MTPILPVTRFPPRFPMNPNGDQASGLHHPEDESKSKSLCVPCGPVQRRGRETRAERPAFPFRFNSSDL